MRQAFPQTIPLPACELTLSHQPPPPPTINTDSVVWPDTDTQTASIIFTPCPPPIPVSATHSLTLASLGLYNQPS
jgi:hypothetical protein